MAQPSAAVVGCRQLAFVVDEIWHAAGDKSTDTSWYTKRALLAGVYSSTELYMLTDYSPEYADTWESLDRRLADVMRLGSAARDVSLSCPLADLKALESSDMRPLYQALSGSL